MLRGQRNRGIEQALSNLRNFVAHPSGYHMTDPVDAARTLSDLAEIINHLWGVPTPGGRLYPAPISRDVIVMAWNTAGTQLCTALARDLGSAVDPDDQPWQCIIVRAVFRGHEKIVDPGLEHFDSRFEVTHYPADLLWGPGTITDAAAWYAKHHPQPDECEYLDRIFVIRLDENEIYLPMRPSVAVALPEGERAGTWYAIKADDPTDAFGHVRNLATGIGCADSGQCGRCHAETLGIGAYSEVVASYAQPAGPASAVPPDARTPLTYPRSRNIAT
ncbi:hypothetical protein GCM10029978_105530 [Actinoallomurus acanthiterrae]